MDQLTFEFPFTTSYYEDDFYVSKNNFNAYKLIESCPIWPGRFINIYGPKGCGKTHLVNILKKKINSLIIEASKINNDLLAKVKSKECLIIDNYKNNIDQNLLYTIINQALQSNQYIVINTLETIKNTKVELKDLKSRFDSFIEIGINLPTDDLLKVIITKNFSDKQIKINANLMSYILKNIKRSYEEIFKFVKLVDKTSLSTGKPININLIKKVISKINE